MKAFKHYLTESKRTFDFRVRIADSELGNDLLDKIERGLGQFELADISKPKSQPVAHCNEFAALGPVARKQFDVKVNYPTTSEGIRTAIHQSSMIPLERIVVRTALEDDLATPDINPEQSLEAGKDNFPADDNSQEQVGLKRVDSLLKDLAKSRHEPEQVKNVNDAILADKLPKEKAAKTTADLPQGTQSPVTPNKTPRGK